MCFFFLFKDKGLSNAGVLVLGEFEQSKTKFNKQTNELVVQLYIINTKQTNILLYFKFKLPPCRPLH